MLNLLGVQDKGKDAFIEEMWQIYIKWPCPKGEEKEIERCHTALNNNRHHTDAPLLVSDTTASRC